MRNYIKALKPSELITAIHVIAVLVGVPLVVHDAYYDIGVTKYYYYCGAAALLIPALFIGLINKPSVKGFVKTLSTAEKALLVYWAVSALSTLFSPYRFESFWGNEGRFTGLFLMSIYVLAYFTITRYYKPHPFFIYACLLAGTVVFMLGITDFFNLNLFHFKDEILAEHAPIFMSTMGNINFYSGYGAIILGLTAGLYVTWGKKGGAAAFFLILTLSFTGLLVGNSDNAYLSFAVVVGFLPLCLFRTRKGIRRYLMLVSSLLLALTMVKFCDIHFADIVLPPDGLRRVIDGWDGFLYVCLAFWILTAAVYIMDYRNQKQEGCVAERIRIIWGVFLVLAALAVMAVLIDANLLGHADRYGSVKNYVVFNNDWGTHRGYVWRKAVENYMKFPFLQKLLGHGPDTYGIISMFNDVHESAGLYGELFDSVHNEYLQFFVTIGPVGTIAYIVFLALSIRDMLMDHLNPFTVGTAFAILCYSAQAVVSINQPSTTCIMWTVLALGIAECRKAPQKEEKDSHE